MNIVRLIWAWLKDNFITVIAGLLVVVAFGVLYSVSGKRDEFLAKVNQRTRDINTIDGLMKQSVKIPPDRPDDPPREVGPMVINPEAIDALKRVYQKMNEEYTSIYTLALNINQHKHWPIADGLFPEPVDNYKMYDSRGRYLETFREMMGIYSPTAFLPRLHAGMPPTAAEIKAELDRVDAENAGLNIEVSKTPGVAAPAVVRPQEDELRRQNRSYALLKFLKDRAAQIHIYAVTDLSNSEFPFDYGNWPYSSKPPNIVDMWEGQLGIWLQQDIVEAIGRTNQVNDSQLSVIFSPVKRLDRISIAGLYVGILGAGGIASAPTGRGSVYLTPISKGAPTLPAGTSRLPDNFAISPTGRQSNSIYDVHHVWVRMVMSYQRMPDFFDNLSKVNFMTVLKMDIKGLDEYEALKAGYVFGSDDCVVVDMLIESLWLRDWTTRMTPRAMRKPLGMSDADLPPAPIAPVVPGRPAPGGPPGFNGPPGMMMPGDEE